MKTNNNNLIAFIGNSDYVQTAYADLRGQDGIALIGLSCFDYYNIICKKLHVRPLFIIYYFLSLYYLFKYCSKKKNNVILFHGVYYLKMLGLPLCKMAKKYYKAKIVGVFWDSVDFERYSAYKYKEEFDLMISADPEINDKYGIINYPYAFYSRIKIEPIEDKCDVFYLGENGGRLPLLEKVYAKLSGLGYRCEFYCGKSDRAGETINGIKHIARMPYMQYLSHVNNCNVILDIIKPGISGPSFRHIEGVMYDKKVLTNNPIAKELSFYDDKQFYIFDDKLIFNRSFMDSKLQTPNLHKEDLSPQKFVDFIYSKLNLVN